MEQVVEKKKMFRFFLYVLYVTDVTFEQINRLSGLMQKGVYFPVRDASYTV